MGAGVIATPAPCANEGRTLGLGRSACHRSHDVSSQSVAWATPNILGWDLYLISKVFLFWPLSKRFWTFPTLSQPRENAL